MALAGEGLGAEQSVEPPGDVVSRPQIHGQTPSLISLSRWRDSLLFIYDLEFRSEKVVSGMGVGTFISIKNEANILMSFLRTTSLICPVGLANKVWFCSLDSLAGISHKVNELDLQPRGFG